MRNWRLCPTTNHSRFTIGSTSPDSTPGDLAFLVGSCRCPGRFCKARQADKVFGPMLDEAQGRQGRSAARFVLMASDQICADKFLWIQFRCPVGELVELLRPKTRKLSRLMSRCPRPSST